MAGVLARLPADMLSMMRGGVSVQVGSRGRDMRPSVMRAVGSDLDLERDLVTVYLWQPQAHQLLADIAATGHIAAVFSHPRAHATVQLKARQARLRAASEGERPVLQGYLASMEDEIGAVGFTPAFARALLAHRHEEVMAVTFEPEQAFDQTPGPRAGKPLCPPASRTCATASMG